MRLGVEYAGVETVFAIDKDKNACKAHLHNFGPNSIVCSDITKYDIDAIPDSDIIVGGPPCQDFSIAGTMDGEDGERGRLIWTYLNIIEKKKPKAFLFENVKGLISKKHINTFERFITMLSDIGYSVSWRLLNAWDYGVAQKRERVFVVGIRNDLKVSYTFPAGLSYHPVLRDAIGDLPEPLGMALSQKALDYLYRDERHFKKHRPPTMDEPSPTLPAVLYKGVPYGLFFPENHHGHFFDNVGNNPTWDHANREASLDKPAPTRTEKDRCDGTVTINGYPRRFTVRECLRIQSVPDSYVFPQTVSLTTMYRVVGNGVPPRIVYYLMKELVAHILG